MSLDFYCIVVPAQQPDYLATPQGTSQKLAALQNVGLTIDEFLWIYEKTPDITEERIPIEVINKVLAIGIFHRILYGPDTISPVEQDWLRKSKYMSNNNLRTISNWAELLSSRNQQPFCDFKQEIEVLELKVLSDLHPYVALHLKEFKRTVQPVDDYLFILSLCLRRLSLYYLSAAQPFNDMKQPFHSNTQHSQMIVNILDSFYASIFFKISPLFSSDHNNSWKARAIQRHSCLEDAFRYMEEAEETYVQYWLNDATNAVYFTTFWKRQMGESRGSALHQRERKPICCCHQPTS
ncbi:hypothetical protein F4679DRAFT_598509 [Xylaria curta]|nr:hypothetical protein F4679DRAFT_598509 [Xylaria curta]